MVRILKYTLHEHGEALLPLPQGAKILHVADQCGALQLWAEVDCELLQSRRFAVVYTGFDEVPPAGRYIGTALSHGGNVVRHVYEILSQR